MSGMQRENDDPQEGHDPKEGHEPAEDHFPKVGRGPKETLERGNSKSRLSKQEEVEEEEQDHSPSSEASDATIVATGIDTPVVRTPGGSPESYSPDDGSKLESQKSVDSDKSSPTQGNNPKAKLLVRSKAVCDDTSPPPEDTSSQGGATVTQMCTSTTTTLSTSNSASVSPIPMATLSVSPTPHRRHKLEKDSSQGSVSDNSNSPMLSRDSSMEYYTDSTGTDLESFIKMTLNKNRNDRITLMELETKMSKFIKDSKQQYYKFHQMSSYHRMLVHRVAAFFGLDHNVDQSGKCVVVNRTSNTRIPDFRFNDHISDEMSDDQPKKLLKRDVVGGSLDETRNPERMLSKKSKSLEERKDNYERVKSRIFSDATGRVYSDNSQDSSIPEGSTTSGSHPSIHKSSSKEEAHWSRWSSADSSGYSTDNSLKTLKITKASSFPSYVLSRSDSRTMGGTRLTTTDSQSSGTSGLSSPMTRPATIPSSPPPSEQLSESSGSNQSATSPAQLHPQTGDAHSPGPMMPQLYDDGGQPMTIWVATSTSLIPPGSIIINKQTCQPYLNTDGTVYRWSPNTPGLGHHVGQAPAPGQHFAQPPGQGSGLQEQNVHQGDVYMPVNYNCPPGAAPQQQLVPPGVQPFQPQESSANVELTQRVATLTLSPQHSTESLPPEPPGAIPGQHAMFGNVHQAGPQTNIAPQGYSQMPQQQGQYFVPNTSTCNPQIRIMYQPTMPYQRPSSQGQGQMEVQSQGQVLSQPGQGQGQTPAANGQYAVPQRAYQSPFSQLTVHSVDYQQQGYQQHVVGGQPSYSGEIPAQPQQQQQQHQQPQQPQPQQQQQQQQQPGSMSQLEHMNYSQYVGQGGVDHALSQSAYVPIQGYMPPSSGVGTSSAHLVAFQGHQVQGHYPGSQGTAPYRPKSPPSQPPMSNLPPQGPNGAPGANIGQPMPNIPVNPAQFVSFAYPGQQQGVGGGAHTGTHPTQPVPQPMGMAGPRHQTPQMWNQLSQGLTGGAPSQGFPIMRPPALQIGDNRFIGQPLQQVPRPSLQPLFTGRPRVPAPGSVVNQTCTGTAKGVKGRKSWSKGSPSSALSPQSSVESTESSEELSGTSTLEVYGLPSTLTRLELDAYLEDLTNLGGRIHILGDDEPNAHHKQLSEVTVLAVFESEYAASRAQTCHNKNLFKLRPFCLRTVESSDLATISEHGS